VLIVIATSLERPWRFFIETAAIQRSDDTDCEAHAVASDDDPHHNRALNFVYFGLTSSIRRGADTGPPGR